MNKLYLNSYEINTCKVFTCVANRVLELGGEIVEGTPFIGEKHDISPTLLININNKEEKFIAYYKGFISFVLDNIYYTIHISDNPFDEYYYNKIRVEEQANGEYRYYGEFIANAIDREKAPILWNAMTNEQVHYACDKLFDFLIDSANFSERYCQYRKHRVYHNIGSGYHYEMTCTNNYTRKLRRVGYRSLTDEEREECFG